MKKYLLLITFLFTLNLGHSQNLLSANLSKENIELFEQLESQEQNRIIRVNSYMNFNKKASTISKDSLKFIYIYDVVDNIAIYKSTHNLQAARGTKTVDLQINGSLGLNLDGSGMTLGIWDFGPIDSAHPEFQNRTNTGSRVTNVDNTRINVPFSSIIINFAESCHQRLCLM